MQPRWPHQEQEFQDNRDLPRLVLGWEPRLGKTRAAIDFLVHNTPLHAPGRILVTAPLVVCPQWANELEKFGFAVTRGYAFKKAEQMNQALFDSEGTFRGKPKLVPKTAVLVLNVDKLQGNQGMLVKWGPEAYIGDECHAFQNHMAARTKAMRKIAAGCRYLRFLSGTMMPNNPGNLWPFMQLVDPDNWEETYAQFKRRHLIMDYMYPSKVTGVIDPGEIERRLKVGASRLTRLEVFGPDSTQVIVRDVPFNEKARALYKQVADEWIATNEAGGILDATHALSRLIRLQQISAGYGVYDGNPETVDNAKVRSAAEEAKELMENGENVVVFYRYKQEYLMFAKEAAELNLDLAHIDGSVSGEMRHSLVSEFNGARGKLLVAQLVAGGIGISLASANYALFLTRSFSYVEDTQARDRIYSPGQAKCLVFYERPKSIDKYIASVLERKKSLNDALMSGNLKSILFGE